MTVATEIRIKRIDDTRFSSIKDFKAKDSIIDRVKTSTTGMTTLMKYCLSDM